MTATTTTTEEIKNTEQSMSSSEFSEHRSGQERDDCSLSHRDDHSALIFELNALRSKMASTGNVRDGDGCNAESYGTIGASRGTRTIVSMCVLMLKLAAVWTVSHLVYQCLQVVQREHCNKNLFNAVFFANSSACIYLNKAISTIEVLASHTMRSMSLSLVYTFYRVVAFAVSNTNSNSNSNIHGTQFGKLGKAVIPFA